MTPEERAEKTLSQWQYSNGTRESHVKILADEIREAMEEAWGKDDLDHFARVKRQAEREAYEDAAKIALDEREGFDLANEIARDIRARAKEVAGE